MYTAACLTRCCILPTPGLLAVIARAARSLLLCAEVGDSCKLGSDADLTKHPVLLPLFLVCLSDQVVIINAISNPPRASGNRCNLPQLYFMLDKHRKCNFRRAQAGSPHSRTRLLPCQVDAS